MAIPTPVETTASTPRLAVFDGLRGIAIILVVLSHGWVIFPFTEIQKNDGLLALFTSGNFAVSIFFVIGAFFATRAMLRDADSSRGLLPGVSLVRRWIRLSGQMYVLLLVVLLVTAVDATDTYQQTATRESVFRAATYTWNWYVRNAALEARPDLGHLWYLSVDMQMFILILMFVWLLRRRRVWLVVALSLFLVTLLVWRTHIFEAEGAFSALLRTWARGDAPVTGALAAAALPYLSRYASQAKLVTTVSLLALVPLLYYTSDVEAYFHLPGVLLDVALFGFVVGCTLATPPRIVRGPLGWRPLAFLGRHSLSIYLWHYPIFWFVARHSTDWRWEVRTLVSLAITALLVVVNETLVEARVRRWLSSPKWRATDRGLGQYLGHRVGSTVRAAGRRARRSDATEGVEEHTDEHPDKDQGEQQTSADDSNATPR